MQRGLTTILAALLVALIGAPGLNAAVRDGSKGDWNTGEITEAEYASRWGYGATDQGNINVISADEKTKQAGDASVKLYTETGFDTWMYFPNTKDLDLDCSKIGSISFLLFTQNKNNWGGDPWVILRDMSNRQMTYKSLRSRLVLTLTQWVPYAIPVFPETQHVEIMEAYGWKMEGDRDFDWSHLASVEIHADTGGFGFEMYVDDMRFNARGKEPIQWWLSSIDKPDMTATYAERLPHYPRNMLTYENVIPEIRPEGANAKHWPDEGEDVKWIVHVRNEGFQPSPSTDFLCTIDGKEILRTELKPMKPKTETTVTVPWKWQNGAHDFLVTLDTANKMDEVTKKNNTLGFQTNAYTLFAIAEKSWAAKVEKVCNRLGSFSAEDQLRASTVDRINWMMVNSTYDFAPKGSRARVRMDKVIYVDNIKSMPQSEKPGEEIDGGWYYDDRCWIEHCNLTNSFMWSLNHEITHQLGIIDNYQYDLGADSNKVNGIGFGQPDGGIMGGGRTNGRGSGYYADVDIAGFEATYGYRRGYFGEYIWCVPDQNTVRVMVNGKPIANTEISVYQKKWDEGWGRDTTGNGTIPNKPIMTGKTDTEGRYTFENRPVLKEYTTATGCKQKPNPFGYIDVVGRNSLLMLRANVDGKWYYGFMDIGLFNVEYARGHKEHGNYELKLLPEAKPSK